MAYDRNESRRGWREPRSRFSADSDRSREGSRWDNDGSDDRGFFERAGDEVASWFGDEDATRRRQMDNRFDEDDRRPSMRDDDFGRQSRFRDEGYRRPYTGRSSGRQEMSSDRYRPFTGDYGRTGGRERDEDRQSRFTGMASTAGSPHDQNYSEWRRRQIDALDRDYDDYRRENQSRFESDFSSWRDTRQTKRGILGQVREHMNVVGSDDEPVGVVDHVRGDRIILTKNDSSDGRHHKLSCSMIDRVEGDRVILDKAADEAKKQFASESRNRALFERDDDDRDAGPHMLNRSFSGTY